MVYRRRAIQYNGDAISQVRPYKSVWMYFAAAAAAKDVVEIDTATEPPGGGTNIGQMAAKKMASQRAVGGCLRAVTAATWGEVVVQGIQNGINTTGAAIIAGDQLIGSATDGALKEAASSLTWETNGTTQAVARCLVAPSADPGTDAVIEWFNIYGY